MIGLTCIENGGYKMNYTIWQDIENKLACGYSYADISEITGVDIKDIKKIEKYIEERENGK